MDALFAFIETLVVEILNPIFNLLFAVAFLIFVYGGFLYFYEGAGIKDESREKGKKRMIGGIIGMAVMLTASGLLVVFLESVGVGPADLPDTASKWIYPG